MAFNGAAQAAEGIMAMELVPASQNSPTITSAPLIKDVESRVTAFVVFTCIMAGTGGLMYGYDLVIAGGISVMDDFLLKFYPSVYMHKKNSKEDNYCKYNNQVFQLFSSSFYLAAFVATFIASWMSRKHGRKATMLCASILFIVGTVLGAAAQNLAMLLLGRVFLGCGLGFSNQAVPMFLSEIAPPSIRGGLNLLFGVFIAVGILSGNIVNYVAGKIHPWGWRLSLGLAGIPGLLLAICSLIVVETPLSLLERGKHERAKHVLCKLRGLRSTDVATEFNELVEACASHRGRSSWAGYKDLFWEKKHRGEMVVVCMLPFFQQVVGNDAILFYGVFLFKLAGFGDQAALYSAVITGAVNLLTVCAAVFLVDRVGRRHLLLSGCLLMASSLGVVGSIFGANLKGGVNKLPHTQSIIEVIFLCVFVAGFGVSLGPLAWLIPSEILSPSVRSTGQSVAVFVNMFFKFVIAQTFLSMLCAFKFGIFFFFGGGVLVFAIFVLLLLPETKHIPLHKMETLWQEHWFWKRVALASPSSKPT